MATKRMSRTAIEGGRSRYNKYARRQSYADERARVRDEIRKVTVDADLADDWGLEKRQKVYKDFADKLGPPKRWLRKQAGRPWDEVYRDLKQNFDPRTTAGRHLVYDHMLRWVHRDGENRNWWHTECTVDNDGILRESPLTKRQHNDGWRAYRAQQRAIQWMAGRKILDYGTAQFWAVPVERAARSLSPKSSKVDSVVIHHRQDRRLDDEEARFWRSLSPEIRKELVVAVINAGSSSAFSTTAVHPADYRTIGVRIPEGGLLHTVRGATASTLDCGSRDGGSIPLALDWMLVWDVMRLVSLSDCRSDSDGFDPRTSRSFSQTLTPTNVSVFGSEAFMAKRCAENAETVVRVHPDPPVKLERQADWRRHLA
jgi:hypothetical protein